MMRIAAIVALIAIAAPALAEQEFPFPPRDSNGPSGYHPGWRWVPKYYYLCNKDSPDQCGWVDKGYWRVMY